MRGGISGLFGPLAIVALVAILLLGAAGGASAEGGTYPASPFNGLQITYSVGGATLGAPTDVSSFTTSRTYKNGKLAASGNLEVSGSATGKCDSIITTDIIAEVWAGDQKKTFNYKMTCGGYGGPRTTNYSVSVPIPAGATAGGFGVTLNLHTAMGSRSLVVSGSLSGTATSTGATPTVAVVKPTNVPAQARLVIRATAPEQVSGFGPNTGDDVIYLVRVTNEGTAPARNVVLSWSATASSGETLTYGPNDQGSGWDCTGNGPQAVGCGPVTLGPGESASAGIILMPPVNAGIITLNATVQGDCDAGSCSDNWSGVTSVVQDRPQIRASIEAPSGVSPGEELRFVFRVANISSVPLTTYANLVVPGFEAGWARIVDQSSGVDCHSTTIDFGEEIPFMPTFPAGGATPIIGCGPFDLKAGETASVTLVAVSPETQGGSTVQLGIAAHAQSANGAGCGDSAGATVAYGGIGGTQ